MVPVPLDPSVLLLSICRWFRLSVTLVENGIVHHEDEATLHSSPPSGPSHRPGGRSHASFVLVLCISCGVSQFFFVHGCISGICWWWILSPLHVLPPTCLGASSLPSNIPQTCVGCNASFGNRSGHMEEEGIDTETGGVRSRNPERWSLRWREID